MLGKLIDAAVERRGLTLALGAVFVIFGIHTLGKLRIEAFPDVTNVQVMVIGLYPGQAAEEVEKKVTIPVERALVGVPRALMQRSITSFGLSQVIVTFDDDVDIYFARQQIAERLGNAEVPEGVNPELGPNDTPVGQVYQYTLKSDRHTPTGAARLAGVGRQQAPGPCARGGRCGELRWLPKRVACAGRPSPLA